MRGPGKRFETSCSVASEQKSDTAGRLCLNPVRIFKVCPRLQAGAAFARDEPVPKRSKAGARRKDSKFPKRASASLMRIQRSFETWPLFC